MYSFYDYLPYMADGGLPEMKKGGSVKKHSKKHAAKQQASRQSNADRGAEQQIMQIIQAFAQMKGVDPRQIAQQLQQMPPEQQQQAVQQMAQAVQQGAGQQQQGPPQQQGSPEPNGIQEYPQGQEPQQEMPPQQMQQQQMMQQQGSPMMAYGGMYQAGGMSQQGGGGQQDEAQQIITAYAQMANIKPDELIKKLQEMEPAKQKKAYAEMKTTVIKALQKQQSQSQDMSQQQTPFAGYSPQDAQGIARHGGYISHDGSYRQASGSGTMSGNVYYEDGGMYNYGGQYEDGGDIPNYMKETSPMYNFGGYFPQGPRFEDGGQMMDGQTMGQIPVYKGGGIHIKPSHKGRFTEYKKRTGKTTEEALHSPDPHVRQMANFARNAAKWKHADGGIVVGNTYDASPEMIQKLKDGGYNFEYID